MNHDEIIKAWNNQADKHNRWSDLGEDEMLKFAMRLEREACKGLWEAQRLTDNQISDHIKAAVAAEREACANIAEDHQHDCYDGDLDWHEAKRITAAIRARGEQK